MGEIIKISPLLPTTDIDNNRPHHQDNFFHSNDPPRPCSAAGVT